MSCVLITGAGGGLGSALARAFHRRGHALLLADLDAELVRATARNLGDTERIAWSSGDIATPEHQRALLRQAEQRFGGVAVLVNNAGITHRSLVAKTDPAVLRRVMEVDWQAPLELALAALPQLRAHRGSIVAIGSMAGWMPVLGRAAYCGAKSALAQSFEVLRCEEQRHGIHVLMAYPSFLDTPIERNALGHDGKPARHPRSMIGKAMARPVAPARPLPAASAGRLFVHLLEVDEARRPHVLDRVDVDVDHAGAAVLQRTLHRTAQLRRGRHAFAESAHRLRKQVEADLPEIGLDRLVLVELLEEHRLERPQHELLVHLDHAPLPVAQNDPDHAQSITYGSFDLLRMEAESAVADDATHR